MAFAPAPSFKDPPLPTSITPPPSFNPPATAVAFSPVKPELSTPSTSTATAATPRPPPTTPSSDPDVVHIPSYSRWFSWNDIHECEVRNVPEFFDSRSPAKNPRVYKYYRNSIIKYFRRNNPSGKITFTEVRRTLVGDAGSIRRVFDFLEAWGLINYSPNALNKPLKWEDKDAKSSGGGGDSKGASADNTPPKRDTTKRLCNGCQSVCTIACFVCDKYDLTLCARCYVRGNYRVGVSSTDFRRVEISEEIRSEWTEKETLQLLEAITHFGDDWRKVALHVPGRSDKDCVTQFLKLPFGEQFSGYTDLGELNHNYERTKDSNDTIDASENNDPSSASKRMRLTPLADASNPIMSQAAFLSALAGAEVAEAAAQAAITALNEASKSNPESFSRNRREQVANARLNGNVNQNGIERTSTTPEKEDVDAERAISKMVEVQMKEMQDKIVHFEELDLQMEKEWQQLELMKNLLFVDQLTLLFNKKSTPQPEERVEDNPRTNLNSIT
ncbi:SWI/SNF complex subunit SWI3B [Mercurialis annua]|uniref:SWI/SNF complex subunit SWI3B n=1 Tax=Mercurialis annua TaxID=3986 RepID=UPI00215EA9EA|nr:SWI/SNF complex subunit SWI3B [Mercurialis annua]